MGPSVLFAPSLLAIHFTIICLFHFSVSNFSVYRPIKYVIEFPRKVLKSERASVRASK